LPAFLASRERAERPERTKLSVLDVLALSPARTLRYAIADHRGTGAAALDRGAPALPCGLGE
jgi:hypothetical protein